QDRGLRAFERGGAGCERAQRGGDPCARRGAELAGGQDQREVIEQRRHAGDQRLLGREIRHENLRGVRAGGGREDRVAEKIRGADRGRVVGDLELGRDEARGGERAGINVAGLEEIEDRG